MGLDLFAKGIKNIGIGYSRFNFYREQIARIINNEMGDIYSNQTLAVICDKPISQTELNRWNELSNDELNLFFYHSDCEGKFTPKECRIVYNILKDLSVENCEEWVKDFHKKWLEVLLHCYKRRVNLYFL